MYSGFMISVVELIHCIAVTKLKFLYKVFVRCHDAVYNMEPACTVPPGQNRQIHLIAYFLRQTAVAKDCFFCLYVLYFLCLVERRRSNEYDFLPKIKANHLTTLTHLVDSFLMFKSPFIIIHPGLYVIAQLYKPLNQRVP